MCQIKHTKKEMVGETMKNELMSKIRRYNDTKPNWNQLLKMQDELIQKYYSSFEKSGGLGIMESKKSKVANLRPVAGASYNKIHEEESAKIVDNGSNKVFESEKVKSFNQNISSKEEVVDIEQDLVSEEESEEELSEEEVLSEEEEESEMEEEVVPKLVQISLSKLPALPLSSQNILNSKASGSINNILMAKEIEKAVSKQMLGSKQTLGSKQELKKSGSKSIMAMNKSQAKMSSKILENIGSKQMLKPVDIIPLKGGSVVNMDKSQSKLVGSKQNLIMKTESQAIKNSRAQILSNATSNISSNNNSLAHSRASSAAE